MIASTTVALGGLVRGVDGMRWDGMGWDGMGWNLVVSSLLEYDGKGKGWRCATSVHSMSEWREGRGRGREGEREGERVRVRVREGEGEGEGEEGMRREGRGGAVSEGEIGERG